jgi:Zn-dependent protease with chaperone function
MIVLHEAAHILRHHAWIRCLPMLFAFAGMLLIAWLVDHVREDRFHVLIDWMLIACLAMGVLMVWLLGILARWSERDADRHAIALAVQARWLGQGELSEELHAKLRQRARQDLTSALLRLSADGASRSRSWLYPSIRDRIRWLESDGADNEIAASKCAITTG